MEAPLPACNQMSRLHPRGGRRRHGDVVPLATSYLAHSNQSRGGTEPILSAARLFTGLSKHSNSVLRELFPALGLASMRDWDPDVRLPAYLTGAVLPAHSQTRRTAFWIYYSSMATHGRRWLEGLQVHHRANYARWSCRGPTPGR